MVGVPRSRACKLCLQRRVKCDEKRPACLQCQKLGLLCPGYKFHRDFRDEGPRLRQRIERSQPLPMNNNKSTPFPSDTEPQSRECVINVWSEDVRDIDDLYIGPGTPVFSPVVHQQQLLHTFIWSMTASHQNELSPALGTYRRWLPYLFPFTGTHILLDQSVRASTLAHVARLHKSKVLMHEAQMHYGRALRHLNDALHDTSTGLASETLGSTILLSIFEMFTSNSNQTWVRHADGVVTLMKLRGPQRHRAGIDREMFLAYRRTLVSQAIESNHKTFLNEPEWRQLSRDVHDDIRKSGVFADIVNSEIFEVDQLFFLESATLCDLCHDLRHVGQLAQTRGKDAVGITSGLVTSASSCRRTIKSLLRRLKTAIKGAGHEPISHVTSDPVHPVQYEFINMYVASLHVGLWTTITRVNMLLMRFEHSQQKAQQYHLENVQMTRECCQSVVYMATSSFLGPFFMLLALRVCLLALDDPVQKTWIIAKLTELGESKLAIAGDIPRQDYVKGVPQPKSTKSKYCQE